MKKITLALVAAFSSFSMAYSQANISIEAPVRNAIYLDLLPSGANTEASLTAVYLYNASDLSALTGTALTSIGLQLNRGVTGAAVPGTFTVYLKNTTDVTYNAGTSFTTAIQTMTTAYVGNLTIPNNAPNGTTLTITFPQTFTYTGGGLYVGFAFNSTGPFVTAGTNNANLAAYHSGTLTSGANMGAIEQATSTGTLTDVMFPLSPRPSLLFRAANTATNEVGIRSVIAPGKVAKSINAGHVIKAIIKNNTINTMSNITVSLAVGGANTFANSQVISSLAADASATVSFAAFNPLVQGLNTVSVSVAGDQNNSNNLKVWTQSVTCNVMANNPPEPIASFDGAVGFGTEGIFATRFTAGSDATLTAVRISVSSDPDVIGTYLYGILADDQGAIIATTDSVKITAQTSNNFVNFRFPTSQVMSANTTYIIGMAQPDGGTFPMAFKDDASLAPGQFIAVNNVNGGNFQNSTWGYFGIEPVLGPDVAIFAPAVSTVCINEPFLLTSSEGALTYTWSAVPGSTVNGITTPSLASISVVPTKTGNIVYTLRGTDAAGCVNSATVTARVELCTGIYSNVLKDANIKLYPNPAVNSKSTISGLTGANTITVYNILGQAVLTKNTVDETVMVDLTGQPTGNYLVRITDSNNHSKTIKIINQN